MTIWIATDDTGMAYVDGALLFNIPMCRVTVSAKVSNDSKIIAVEIKNEKGEIGLMAMTSSGVVSDTNWKCTSTQPASGWNFPNCNDSKWPQAISYFKNDGTNHNLSYIRMYDFPKNAHWLTTVANRAPQMYCRRSLG